LLFSAAYFLIRLYILRPFVTQVVFGFLGSTISTLKIYVFPALMLLARARQLDPVGPEDAQALLAPQATAIAADSLVPSADASNFHPSRELGSELERADAVSEASCLRPAVSSVSVEQRPHHRGRMPSYLPSSPFWLRVQGYALLVLAVAIAVIGTTSNVLSSTAVAH
jgi:hypothetical protein